MRQAYLPITVINICTLKNHMSIQITFLGTSANVPTKVRNHPAVHLKFLNHNILFDCGEGTQRQLTLAGLSHLKIDAIFLTHIHADHILGLGGIIQTQAFFGKSDELLIFAPREVKRYVDFYTKWEGIGYPFPIKFIEVKEGLIHENSDYVMNAFRVEHACLTYGFVFEEKKEVNLDQKKLDRFGLSGPICKELKEKGVVEFEGKTIHLYDVMLPKKRGIRVAYCVDSAPCNSIIENAKNADLLICEGMYAEDLEDKAHEYFHMTAKDAGRIAKKAKVKRLALTHFSQRYEDEKVLEKEAKTIFKNTIAAKDLMVLEL
jgi:ribonuclease Z